MFAWYWACACADRFSLLHKNKKNIETCHIVL
jgi:hypothetical protein